MKKENPYNVIVGQIWESTDPRDQLDLHGRPTRAVIVKRVNLAKGIAEVVSNRNMRSKIRLDRFKPGSTGYRLKGDAE